jgi:hypothetical protein
MPFSISTYSISQQRRAAPLAAFVECRPARRLIPSCGSRSAAVRDSGSGGDGVARYAYKRLRCDLSDKHPNRDKRRGGGKPDRTFLLHDGASPETIVWTNERGDNECAPKR